MKKEDVDVFKTINAQLFDMHKEMSEMSKKKPDNPINKFKLKYINKIVENANKVLGKNFKPFDDFELFDEDDLPTNSDIAIMLSQYQNAMEKLRCNNIKENYRGNWVWVVEGKESDIETARPSSKFKY